MNKIFIEAPICEKRLLDSKNISNYLSINGYEIVHRPKDADIIIFVTCAVVNGTAEESLRKIEKFQKYKAELIIAGCLSAIEPDKLSKIFNGKTIVTKDLNKIDTLFPKNKIKFSDIEDSNISYKVLDLGTPFEKIIKKFRKVKWIDYFIIRIKNHVLKNLLGKNSGLYKGFIKNPFMIRISWGCPSNCTYCGIRKAVGPLKSKPTNQIIKEFKKGLDEGYTDFILSADNTGAYGLDISSTFPKLLDKMIKIPGEYEITVRYLDPRWVIRYINDLERFLKTYKIGVVDIPVQSGSNRILKLMNRFSEIEEIKNVFLRLKKAFPDVKLSTHIIAGFPTETGDEFKQTLDFIKKAKIDYGVIAHFSCRPGTKAEELEPKVSYREIVRRVRYAKKFLKNLGYNIIYIRKYHSMLFDKRE